MASAELQALQKRIGVTQPKAQVQSKKKGPGGIAGFLVNSLPTITSGIGAVGGSFLTPGAGTVGGGAAGGALGEALKRKILGEKEDIGQIATQGIEGGALSGIGSATRGIKSGAQALTKLGTGAAKEAAPTAEKTGGSFLKNLTTQGQQAQGRVAGISAGSKAAGKELTPQDTAKMLQTFKNENINTGNANNTLRDVTDKLKSYGQSISDHFKANDSELKPEDTKVIASNYLTGLKTTDPAVLKQAQVIADDLEKNVKSTKGLWEFRKTLDSRIPDTKFGDEATTAKISALKSARQYIADELGDVPGAKNYHNLSEIKPFISAEAKRLNNPSGGIIGRVLSSGAVQKGESLAGKGVERLGRQGADNISEDVLQSTANPTRESRNILDKVLQSKGIPVKYEDSTFKGNSVKEIENKLLMNPKVGDVADAESDLKARGFSTTGSLEAPNNVGNLRSDLSGVKGPTVTMRGERTALPLEQNGATERGIIHTPDRYANVIPEDILQAASQATHETPHVTPQSQSFLQKLVGAGANPIANPGQTTKAVLKQEAGRGFGIPAAVSQAQPTQSQTPTGEPDLSKALLDTSAATPEDTNDPYSAANVAANVQAILQQGGKQKDVSDYLSNVAAYQKLTQPAGTSPYSKPSAQQHALAQSAVGSLQQLAQMIEADPSVLNKNATPGQGTPLIGSLVTNAAGAGSYHPLADNILSALIHLQTGATATKEEITAAHGQLPQPGDSAEERQQKIATLLGNFEPFLDNSQ